MMLPNFSSLIQVSPQLQTCIWVCWFNILVLIAVDTHVPNRTDFSTQFSHHSDGNAICLGIYQNTKCCISPFSFLSIPTMCKVGSICKGPPHLACQNCFPCQHLGQAEVLIAARIFCEAEVLLCADVLKPRCSFPSHSVNTVILSEVPRTLQLVSLL